MQLIFDIVWGAFLLGLELLLLGIFLAVGFILLLNFLEWCVRLKRYNGLKRSLLRAAQQEAKKLDDNQGGVCSAKGV